MNLKTNPDGVATALLKTHPQKSKTNWQGIPKTQHCPQCLGWGTISAPVSPGHELDFDCRHCNGTGAVPVKETV